MHSLSWAACWVSRQAQTLDPTKWLQTKPEECWREYTFLWCNCSPCSHNYTPRHFQGKQMSIWVQCRSLFHIYLKPRQRRKKRHYQFFHVLDIYIKHNLLCLINITKHNLFRRIFISFRLGDHTAQFGLGEPGPSQRKSLACLFVLDIHQGGKSYPFSKRTRDKGCGPLHPS